VSWDFLEHVKEDADGPSIPPGNPILDAGNP